MPTKMAVEGGGGALQQMEAKRKEKEGEIDCES